MKQTKPTVLIVDDEVAIFETFQVILEDGFDVLSAENGLEAMALIEKETPALVFLDMRIPGTNGIDILREIKKRRPKIKVIMETGYPDLELALRSIELGASEYITKPFGVQEVQNSLENVLKLREAPPSRERLAARWLTKRRTTFGRTLSSATEPGAYAFSGRAGVRTRTMLSPYPGFQEGGIDE
jgi:DNA-binding NtrC family response regulator